jgi:hypothetical protein
MKRCCLAAAILLSALPIGACVHRSPAVQADLRPHKSLGAGIRYSTYGPKYDPGPAYWARGREMAHFPGAQPEAIWIVGRLAGSGVRLSFPVPAGDPLILGAPNDESEAALTLFDNQGFRFGRETDSLDAQAIRSPPQRSGRGCGCRVEQVDQP